MVQRAVSYARCSAHKSQFTSMVVVTGRRPPSRDLGRPDSLFSRDDAGNLFIFGMGRLTLHKAPIVDTAPGAVNPALYADPVPQALVLTAIVIGFATTALCLVVLLALRGLTVTDHVDGRES